MIFRDDKTRMSWENFLRSKAKAPDKLEQRLNDIRLHGFLRSFVRTMRVS